MPKHINCGWVSHLFMSKVLISVYVAALGAAAAAGNADNRNADIAHEDLTVGITDKPVLNSFPFVQGG